MDNNSHHHESSFWRNHSTSSNSNTNNRGIVSGGRISPRKDMKSTSGKTSKGPVGSTSFQDFQESVRDAWDMGDDEFCIISGVADTKICKKVSQAAALSVIKSHRNSIKMNETRQMASSTSSNSNDNYSNKPDINPIVHQTKHLYSNLAPNVNSSSSSCIATAEANANQSKSQTKVPSSPISGAPRPKHNHHAPLSRPQPHRFSSNLNRDVEHEPKIEKFKTLLEAPLLNLIALKELSWSGIPNKMRAVTWRLLSGYLPTSLERRNSVLERKRLDYHNLVAQYFRVDSQDEAQQDTYRQIHIDVPRMNPHVQLFQQNLVQEMFERILFIWAIRHPASGYVQGINDLVTPFFIIFLQEALGSNNELDSVILETLSVEQRNIIEADSFWCLSKFLDCIQDNYIFAQLGIQAKVNQLKELIQRIDGTLHKQLQTHGVDYLQFSFRWMNNLLTRELPLHCTIRLWDTYLAESDGFAVFQLYVCAAFLLHWRDQLLQERDFQGLMLLLQNLPTHNWTDSQIGILVAEAYRLKFTYADAPKHLEGKS